MRQLALKAEGLRPFDRKSTSQVDVGLTKAILVKNHCDFTQDPNHASYAVDIKPKWSGFLRQQRNSIPLGSADHCRYCNQQVLKGRIKNDSFGLYCPDLLFSKDAESVRKALQGLFSNPSNQLRVFRNNLLLNTAELIQSNELIAILTGIFRSDGLIVKFKNAERRLVESILQETDLLGNLGEHKFPADVENKIALFFNEYISNPSATISLENMDAYVRAVLLMSLRDSSLIIQIVTGSAEMSQRPEWQVMSLPSGELFHYHINIIDLDIKSTFKLARFLGDLKEFG